MPDLMGAGSVASAGAQILSSILQNSQFNKARQDRLNAGDNLLQYVNDNNLPPGYLENAYQILLREMLDKNKGYEDSFSGLQNMFYSGIGDYRQNFDKIFTPQTDNPTLQYLRSRMEEGQNQTNPSIEQFLQIAQNGGQTQNNQALFDTLMSHGSMANPYIRNLVDIGGNILQNGGMTPYTQNASDVAGYFIRNGGMDGNTQNLYDAGFANRDTAAGGIQRADALGQAGRNTLNFGQNVIQDAQRTGGYDANGQQQFNLGMNGINGMKDFFGQDPMSILGATGQQTINDLRNNPYTQQGFDTTQATLQNFLNRPNISGNDQAIINAAFPQAFGTSPTAQQNMGIAQGIAGQDINALAPWFQQFMSQGNNLMSQFQGMGANTISGGGGGGGVSYSPMSRDLGPVDPLIQQNLEKALAEFQNNPLLSDQEVASFARDSASTAARQAGLAAVKKAAAMGGPAPTIAGGGQMDSAIRSFADESMRAQSQAMKDAIMKNAEMRLTRSGQQSDLAKALASIKLGREDIFGKMNIADANNATQAGIANAQMADSAAGRSLQAQIANANNQQAMARLMSDLYGTMLGSATTQRGQNVSSQSAGLGALSDLTNANSNSQKNFLDALNAAAGRGQSQYNANLAASSDALGQLGQYGTQRNNALTSVLGALGDASGQITSRGNNMMDNFTALMNSAGNNAASKYGAAMGAGADIMGTGMSGMNAGVTGYNSAVDNMNKALGISQGALGIANDRLRNYADIFKTSTDDSTKRMQLGAQMTGQGMDAMKGFLDSAAGVTKQQQDYAAAMGNNAANLYKVNQDANASYGNTAANFASVDNSNRKLMNDAFLGYINGLNTGIGNNNTAWGQSIAPYMGILNAQMQYLTGTQSLMGNYGGMFGGGR